MTPKQIDKGYSIFRPGQEVICIDSQNARRPIREGETYYVHQASETYVSLQGLKGTWFARRFQAVKKKVPAFKKKGVFGV